PSCSIGHGARAPRPADDGLTVRRGRVPILDAHARRRRPPLTLDPEALSLNGPPNGPTHGPSNPPETGARLALGVVLIVVVGAALGAASNTLLHASGPRRGLAWLKEQTHMGRLEHSPPPAVAS